MRERPILFNNAMVRAILDGAKTQTRRPVKLREFQRSETAGYDFTFRDRRALWNDFRKDDIVSSKFNPFGVPGDRLWVRECHAFDPCEDSEGNAADRVLYRADHNGAAPLRWRPSIHMPRWASRLTLRVTDVRVERVQDITEDDARAEGFDGDCPVGYLPAYQAGPCRYHFASSWSDTYGPESWTANPWVWVVSFERAEVPRG